MKKFLNKKLLILGGAEIHCKVVCAAKELGIHTIVVDYLSKGDSPAKLIADESYEINIYDVDAIIKLAKKLKVDGVINTSLDPCQIPQVKICNALNLPCYGTPDQYFKLTNKIAFKKLCRDNGVDVIEDYSEDDILKNNVKYPIFIKPVDSRGSRGQSICFNLEEALNGIKLAKSISSDHTVLIEQYLKDKQDFMLSYIVIDGKPNLVRTCDRFEGLEKDGLDKVGALAFNPSRFTNFYIQNINDKVTQMIKNLGIKNGPIFLQGFVDGNTVRMYDPGIRLPGGNYENMFKKMHNVDIIKMLIELSLTGKITETFGIIPDQAYLLNNTFASNLFPMIRSGKISKIEGFDLIKKQKFLVSGALRHRENEFVEATKTVNQRIGEFNICTNSVQEMKNAIRFIYDNLKVFDENGNSMMCSYLDLDAIFGE